MSQKKIYPQISQISAERNLLLICVNLRNLWMKSSFSKPAGSHV
jgi:hypothetical protein